MKPTHEMVVPSHPGHSHITTISRPIKDGTFPHHGASKPLNMSGNRRLKRDLNTTYYVTFRVKYKCEPGEQLCVLGSTDNLGEWKVPTYFLQWTEGDVWVSAKPLVMRKCFFQYKYSMIRNRSEIVGWERGVDRIADLDLMNESCFTATEFSNEVNTKQIEMHDTWETYTINFTVWSHDQQNFDTMNLDTTEGHYQNCGMNKFNQPMPWEEVKYGKLMRPW